MYFKKPKFIKKPKMSAAGRNFYHRQQFSRISGGAATLCNVYPFSSDDADYLEIEPYTGNLKIILAATSEAGIPAAIVTGRQGVFTPSVDPVNDPQWVQYEIDGVIPAIILEATFTGVCGGYAKDDVWYSVDMGAPTVTPIPLGTRILLLVDSTTYGRGASDGSAGVTGAHVNSPCRQLASKLSAAGVSADSHSVVGMGSNAFADSTELYFSETPDVAVTLNSWDKLDFDSIGGDIFRSDTVGSSLVFSFDNVDKAALGFPVRVYGICQYRVDGGAWTTFSQHRDDHSGVDDLARVEIDFGVIGSHTVEVQYVSGAAIYVVYCEAWDSSSQVVVVPWGARGYDSNQLNDTARPWSYKSALSYVPFDAVVINVGINDVRSGGSGTAEATYEANVTAYINAIKAANPSAHIFIEIPNDISTGLSYLPSSITDLAASEGVTLLDARSAVEMADYATADASGHMYDTLHPSQSGYSNIWDEFTPIIKATLEG